MWRFRWWKYQITKWWHDRLPLWVAYRIPRKIAYWCAIRVGANATTGDHSNQIVPELKFIDALARWDD
jgi:hypothetical protein